METANEILDRVYKRAKEFFKIDLPVIKLYIIKDRAKIYNDESKKRKWQGAGFFRKDAVIVMDKSFFKELGYKEEEFEGVILHELSHIFIKHLVRKFIPIWIEEGLCNYLGFPEIKKKPNEVLDFNKIVTLENWYAQGTPFAYCSYFFHFLGDKYSKNKILEFIKSLDKKEVHEAFEDVFEMSFNNFVTKYNNFIQNDIPT